MDQNARSESKKQQINVAGPERLFSMMSGSFLLIRGLRNLSLLQMAAGGFMLYRGATGHCPGYTAMGVTDTDTQNRNIEIDTILSINKPRNEVYEFWRRLENLPLFMTHLENVYDLGDGKSHWVARMPAHGARLEWDAQIIHDEADQMISWSSLPGSTIENSGKVEFLEGYNNQTVIHVTITYSAPLGITGFGISKLLNPVLEKMIREDIRNFKQYIETGQISKGNVRKLQAAKN